MLTRCWKFGSRNRNPTFFKYGLNCIQTTNVIISFSTDLYLIIADYYFRFTKSRKESEHFVHTDKLFVEAMVIDNAVLNSKYLTLDHHKMILCERY